MNLYSTEVATSEEVVYKLVHSCTDLLFAVWLVFPCPLSEITYSLLVRVSTHWVLTSRDFKTRIADIAARADGTNYHD